MSNIRVYADLDRDDLLVYTYAKENSKTDKVLKEDNLSCIAIIHGFNISIEKVKQESISIQIVDSRTHISFLKS